MPNDLTIIIPVSRLKWLYSYLAELFPRFNIGHLILISLALHLFVIPFPQNSAVFDEKYYTQAGVDLINGVASNPEHPFLGKLWGCVGIVIFGNNWFGWRIPFVAFGALTLISFYKLVNLFLDKRRALYASTLLAFDNIFFIHSSLYLLEVPALFFSITTFYLYFKKRYRLAAVMMGLAILSKETSIFFLLALTLYHIAVHAKELLRMKPNLEQVAKPINFNHLMKQLVTFLLIIVVVTAVPLWIYDAAYKPATGTEVVIFKTIQVDEQGLPIGTITRTETRGTGIIDNPLTHLSYILRYQSGLTIRPDSQADQNNYAWNWILPFPPKEMIYYDIAISKNVSQYVGGKLVSSTILTTHPVHWAGIGNLPLWLIGFWLIIPFSTYSILRKRNSQLDILILAWIIGTYSPYLAISLFVQRIVYPFYFINTVPALALGLAALGQSYTCKKPVKYLLALILISVLAWFFWYFPVKVTQF